MKHLSGPADICEMFDISKKTLYRWEADGLVPSPQRDVNGARRYRQEQIEEIAEFVRTRRYRRLYAQALKEEDGSAKSRMSSLGERSALFKFVHLRDKTGLTELREYSPLNPDTLRQLLRVAIEEYSPEQRIFWDIMDVVRETSDPRLGTETNTR